MVQHAVFGDIASINLVETAPRGAVFSSSVNSAPFDPDHVDADAHPGFAVMQIGQRQPGRGGLPVTRSPGRRSQAPYSAPPAARHGVWPALERAVKVPGPSVTVTGHQRSLSRSISIPAASGVRAAASNTPSRNTTMAAVRARPKQARASPCMNRPPHWALAGRTAYVGRGDFHQLSSRGRAAGHIRAPARQRRGGRASPPSRPLGIASGSRSLGRVLVSPGARHHATFRRISAVTFFSTSSAQVRPPSFC